MPSTRRVTGVKKRKKLNFREVSFFLTPVITYNCFFWAQPWNFSPKIIHGHKFFKEWPFFCIVACSSWSSQKIFGGNFHRFITLESELLKHLGSEKVTDHSCQHPPRIFALGAVPKCFINHWSIYSHMFFVYLLAINIWKHQEWQLQMHNFCREIFEVILLMATRNTVNSPFEVGSFLSHYLQGEPYIPSG